MCDDREMSAIRISSSGGLKLVLLDPSGAGVVVPRNPQTAEQMFSENPDVTAAIDGPMFGFCEGTPRTYNQYTCGRVDYFLKDAARGVEVRGNSAYNRRGITFSLVNGRLLVSGGRSPDPRASVAFQCYPGLVERGNIAVSRRDSGPDSESVGRIAVGTMRDGTMFFAHARVSLHQFAVLLRDAGAVWAGYTDGGGSSSLVTRDEQGRLIGSDSDDPRGRRVPSFIVWSASRASSGAQPQLPPQPQPSPGLPPVLPVQQPVFSPTTIPAMPPQSYLDASPSMALPVAIGAAAAVTVAVVLYYSYRKRA